MAGPTSSRWPSARFRRSGRESDIDLVDPWYGGQRDFEIAIDQIEEVAPYIVDYVEKQLEAQDATR